MENESRTVDYSQELSFYPSPYPAPFDYEKSLWDNVVLSLVNQGEPAIASAEANAIIKARRQMFNDKQQGEV